MVLDADVLVRPGTRDILLSIADAGVFRPRWQTTIEAEVIRNAPRVVPNKEGRSDEVIRAEVRATIEVMNTRFPKARVPRRLWGTKIRKMRNDPKDRHVLAAAVGGGATHLVTSNLQDYPPVHREGVTVQSPGGFLTDRLAADPESVLRGLRKMCARRNTTVAALAKRLNGEQHLSGFGHALTKVLKDHPES